MKRTNLSQKPLKRTRFVAKSRASKKITKKMMWEQYELVRPPSPRYSGLKGIYWFLFSQWVRQRDFYTYFGECIDQCGKKANDWHDFDARHYCPASKCGFGLLFDEKNVNGQLKGCNNPTFSPHSFIGYKQGLNKRYGAGTAEKLENRMKKITPEWGQKEYHEHIVELQKTLYALSPP